MFCTYYVHTFGHGRGGVFSLYLALKIAVICGVELYLTVLVENRSKGEVTIVKWPTLVFLSRYRIYPCSKHCSSFHVDQHLLCNASSSFVIKRLRGGGEGERSVPFLVEKGRSRLNRYVMMSYILYRCYINAGNLY